MEGSEAHCHVNCVQHLCKASIGVLHLRRGSWLAWRWLATYWARKMETSSHQSEKGISQGKEVRVQCTYGGGVGGLGGCW